MIIKKFTISEWNLVHGKSKMYGVNQYQCLKSKGRDEARHTVIHFMHGRTVSGLKHGYKILVSASFRMVIIPG